MSCNRRLRIPVNKASLNFRSQVTDYHSDNLEILTKRNYLIRNPSTTLNNQRYLKQAYKSFNLSSWFVFQYINKHYLLCLRFNKERNNMH